MTMSIHHNIVLFAIATILVFANYGEAQSVPEEDCPPGEVPKCEINVNYRINIEKYPHPNSCTYYFICSNGVPHCLKCKDGLFYNPGTERCDENERDDCKDITTEPPVTSTSEQPITSTTEPPTTTDATTDPGSCENPDPEPECPVCPCDGGTFKHPFECEWYYECEDNVPVLKHCEGGFHWNDKLKVCDYPCLAGCDPDLTPPPVETTTALSTVETSSSVPTTEEPSSSDPTTEEPSSSDPTTEEPSSSDPTTEEPSSTDPTTEEPSSSDPTTEEPSSSDPTTLEPSSSDPTSEESSSPDPTTEEPSSSDPTSEESSSPDPTTEEPSSSDNSSEESPSPDPTTEKPSSASPSSSTSSNNGCPDGPLPTCPFPDPPMAVYFPHALTCSWFYECSNGTPYCMPCSAGLHFNPNKNVCDWPQNAGCTAES